MVPTNLSVVTVLETIFAMSLQKYNGDAENETFFNGGDVEE